jgi:hypothetical protein
MRRFLFLFLLAALGLAAHLRCDDDDDAADAEALFQKGMTLELAHRYQDAVLDYQAALAEDPDLTEAELGQGRCYYLLGWKDQALIHLRTYLDNGGKDPDMESLAASIEAQRRRLDGLGTQATLAAAGPWALQGELGYGWGLGEDSFGHRYNRENNANAFSYGYSPGEGLAYGVEPLYAINPNLAVGVSFLPLDIDTNGTATDTQGATSTVDNTQAREWALPILLNVHTSARLGPGLKLTCFGGVGGVFSRPYVETATDSITTATTTYTQNSSYQRNVEADLAFRGGLGLEWLLNAHCGFFLNASLLLARLPATSISYSSTTLNSAGQVVGTSTSTSTFSSDPPATQAIALPSIPTTGTAGSSHTYTYDNGPTQWTSVVNYNSSGNLETYKTDFNETNVLPDSDDVTNFKVLAATAGLRWDF